MWQLCHIYVKWVVLVLLFVMLYPEKYGSGVLQDKYG